MTTIRPILLMFIFICSSAFSADFTLQNGAKNTIAVAGCGRSEIGDVRINPSFSGEHLLTTRCLPIYCVYKNETALTWFGTRWTIKLLARDSSRDSAGILKGEPQFDRRFEKILNQGVKTKEERDAMIRGYLQNGTCMGVFYDKNVPAV